MISYMQVDMYRIDKKYSWTKRETELLPRNEIRRKWRPKNRWEYIFLEKKGTTMDDESQGRKIMQGKARRGLRRGDDYYYYQVTR